MAESKRKINSIIEAATANGNEEAALAMSKARFHRVLSYIDDIEGMSEESISLLKQFKEEYKNIEKLNEIKGDWKECAIPTAPLDKNWPELCMTRMLRYAEENGFEKMASTEGA